MNVREAMMDSAAEKLDLTETGTRYDHWMELKEVFMVGLEVINGMRPAFMTDGDRALKVKLGHAIELIDRRLVYCSDYDNKIFAVGREVRAAGIHRSPQLTEGDYGRPQAKQENVNQSGGGEVANGTSDISGAD